MQLTLENVPVGIIKTFGKDGIAYQVNNPIKQLENDVLVDITLLQSGERTEYKLSKLLQDPVAE